MVSKSASYSDLFVSEPKQYVGSIDITHTYIGTLP